MRRIENIYSLNGKVPFLQAAPFGLQHILAMFVANLTPITLIGAACGLADGQLAILLQNAMFAAGIATLIQLFPLWKVGSGLPIVMGISFTFVAILSYVGATFGYPAVMGAVLAGGIFEGCLGLLARYWRGIITPVVAACVVTSIGFSLLSVGTRSFGGGYGPEFGSWMNLGLGTFTLVSCLVFNILAKGFWKQLSVLFGLIMGYLAALALGQVDLSAIFADGWIALPRLMPFTYEFRLSAILPVCIIFMVSAAETIGDTTAIVSGSMKRSVKEKEIAGSLACDGFASAAGSLFGCPPLTSFSQNVGLVNMTGVINRNTLAIGAGFMILAGLLPPIGNFFASLPEAVLGGCTLMMFGTIVTSGIEMLAKAGFTQRNITIAALSLSVGVGFTTATEADLWHLFPQLVQDIFASNCVAVVFVMAVVLNLILPKNMEVQPVAISEEPEEETLGELETAQS